MIVRHKNFQFSETGDFQINFNSLIPRDHTLHSLRIRVTPNDTPTQKIYLNAMQLITPEHSISADTFAQNLITGEYSGGLIIADLNSSIEPSGDPTAFEIAGLKTINTISLEYLNMEKIEDGKLKMYSLLESASEGGINKPQETQTLFYYENLYKLEETILINATAKTNDIFATFKLRGNYIVGMSFNVEELLVSKNDIIPVIAGFGL